MAWRLTYAISSRAARLGRPTAVKVNGTPLLQAAKGMQGICRGKAGSQY